MVIMMKASKSLIVTANARLFQGENAVESLVFYIDENAFEDIKNLADYTATLYYTNPVNEAYIEVLEKLDESQKEGFLQYQLPVTTKFTKVAGDIEIQLVLSWNEEETNTQHVLKSGKLIIHIDTFIDYFKYIPNDALTPVTNMINNLDAKANQLSEVAQDLELKTPDDLVLTKDILQLSKEGTPMGQGVEIMVPGNPDLEDESHDGIIDLDDIEPGPTPPTPEIPVFVEL